ncbi:MAG: U32 family peptidase, partial [Victivallales bacterium]|nr:U32 family peptidase [Victivallales bacterium]
MSEILAPAGSPEVLAAALAAGADAVYFGLKKLNARRGAVNFEPVTLESTVTQIHSAGAKAYLTLNIMLCQRELGLAYRTLQCAQNAGVDAVLITDPALLDVIPFFPKLDFHFSTQAAISSSAGVNAAKALGIKRIVLARELSHDEIASCADCGVEIEIFIQGAHCFSCSGRCLLSSWGGGRSGNRGACTSPCRVRWTNDHDVAANPLSMHDMSLLQDLRELEALHLASYKIEGRLKNAKWVSSAVKLAQEALEPDMNLLELQEKAQVLGDYTGRRLSDDFYHGQRHGLTGDSARRALGQLSADCAQNQVETDVAPHLIVTVTPDERNGLHVSLSHGDATDSLRIPPQRIANPKRAVTLSDIFSELPNAIPSNEPTPEFVIPKELSDILLPKSIRNNIHEFISTFLRLKDRDTDGVVRNISLPEQVLELLEKQPFTCPDNSRML